jgi:hypothetical protein
VNHRPVFTEQAAQANGGIHLTVGQVLDNLACAPFAGQRMCRQLFGGKSFEAVGHFVVSGLVLRNQLLSLFRCHPGLYSF